jgi:anti-anti-sigma regulatory factor
MLKITPTVQGDFAVLLLSGRIEEASIPQLESLINAEQRGIVLDLTEVTLVSPSRYSIPGAMRRSRHKNPKLPRVHSGV